VAVQEHLVNINQDLQNIALINIALIAGLNLKLIP
jgi:hypothetical protein